jgi:hypothetical protein
MMAELPQREWDARRRWTEGAEGARGREIDNEVYHYLRWRDTAAQKLSDETGLSERAARREVNRADSDFHDAYWKARRADFPKGKKGVFADFLIFVGYRDPDDWWDVGDTPEE